MPIAPPAPLSRGRRIYLWVLIFVSGMSVMALELTASRVLAPHFGTSIFVWANVIGLIMVALSVGYLIGGRYAERRPELAILLRIVAAGAIAAAIIPAVVRPLASRVIDALGGHPGAVQVVVGSFVTLLLLFGLPIVLLGMTSPFAIRLLTLDRPQVGEAAGTVFAVSTLGSIVGTFAPAFFLVPTIGTRATLLLFAAILLGTVAVGMWGLRGALVGAALLALVPGLARAGVRPSARQLAEVESAYQFIEVTEDGPVRALRFEEGMTVQSEERSDSPLTNGYWDLLLPMPNLVPSPKPRVLILGLAVGTIAKGIVESRPAGAVSVVGVELDPAVVALGEKFFSLARLHDRIEVHVEDARAYLEHSTERVDMILLDVYANQRYIPPHLVTEEFFQLARAHLAPGGFLVANVNSPTTRSKLLQSFVKTLRQAFPLVEAIQVPKKWNFELVCSAEPLDWEGAGPRIPDSLQVVYNFARKHHVQLDDAEGQVFTDDRAPVELLTDSAVFDGSRAHAR
jgi:spermidine synthase